MKLMKILKKFFEHKKGYNPDTDADSKWSQTQLQKTSTSKTQKNGRDLRDGFEDEEDTRMTVFDDEDTFLDELEVEDLYKDFGEEE